MADAFTPMAQEGDNATTSIVAAPSGLEPVFSGPSPTLWGGVLLAIAIFVILIAAIIRVRVTEPAKRKAQQSVLFEPAGADADIVFEDEEEQAVSSDDALEDETQTIDDVPQDDDPLPEQHDEPIEDAILAADNDDQAAERDGPLVDDVEETFAAEADAEPSVEKKKRGPFAGLFSKRDAPADDQETALGDLNQENETIDVADDHDADTDQEPVEEPVSDETFQSASAFAAVPETPDRERLLFEAEERDRVIRAAREEAAREAAFERRKMEASFEERLSSLAAVERSFADRADAMSVETNATRDHLNQTIDERFAALSEALKEQLDSGVAAAAAKSSLDEDAMARLGEDIRELRESTQSVLKSLGERLDGLNKEPPVIADLARQLKSLDEKASVAPASAVARVQLKTLISDALPHGRYDFARTLSSGRTPDCCVSVRAGGPPLAIDAQFPIAAYERRRTEADSAKSDYRRAVLQHIVDVAEKCIIAGETEDSALLYAPAETIFNDLHANFPDLIEDALRARVWIVSPTSLMAVLHAMSFGAQLPKDAAAPTENPTAEDKDAARTDPKPAAPPSAPRERSAEQKPAPTEVSNAADKAPESPPPSASPAVFAPPQSAAASSAPKASPTPGAVQPATSAKKGIVKNAGANTVGVPAKAHFIRQVHTKATPTLNMSVEKPADNASPSKPTGPSPLRNS